MMKFSIMMALTLVSVAGFSQSKTEASAIIKDPKTIENAAKADVTLVDRDKKTITTVDNADKRKKPRRVKAHKECSRMKS